MLGSISRAQSAGGGGSGTGLAGGLGGTLGGSGGCGGRGGGPGDGICIMSPGVQIPQACGQRSRIVAPACEQSSPRHLKQWSMAASAQLGTCLGCRGCQEPEPQLPTPQAEGHACKRLLSSVAVNPRSSAATKQLTPCQRSQVNPPRLNRTSSTALHAMHIPNSHVCERRFAREPFGHHQLACASGVLRELFGHHQLAPQPEGSTRESRQSHYQL